MELSPIYALPVKADLNLQLRDFSESNWEIFSTLWGLFQPKLDPYCDAVAKMDPYTDG